MKRRQWRRCWINWTVLWQHSSRYVICTSIFYEHLKTQ